MLQVNFNIGVNDIINIFENLIILFVSQNFNIKEVL